MCKLPFTQQVFISLRRYYLKKLFEFNAQIIMHQQICNPFITLRKHSTNIGVPLRHRYCRAHVQSRHNVMLLEDQQYRPCSGNKIIKKRDVIYKYGNSFQSHCVLLNCMDQIGCCFDPHTHHRIVTRLNRGIQRIVRRWKDAPRRVLFNAHVFLKHLRQTQVRFVALLINNVK